MKLNMLKRKMDVISCNAFRATARLPRRFCFCDSTSEQTSHETSLAVLLLQSESFCDRKLMIIKV